MTFRNIFSLTATSPSETYTLSLHDALPICFSHIRAAFGLQQVADLFWRKHGARPGSGSRLETKRCGDRKSTRLNSSHPSISYAVFCLKKKIYLLRTSFNRSFVSNDSYPLTH